MMEPTSISRGANSRERQHTRNAYRSRPLLLGSVDLQRIHEGVNHV